jgi:hypothetical protein
MTVSFFVVHACRQRMNIGSMTNISILGIIFSVIQDSEKDLNAGSCINWRGCPLS